MRYEECHYLGEAYITKEYEGTPDEIAKLITILEKNKQLLPTGGISTVIPKVNVDIDARKLCEQVRNEMEKRLVDCQLKERLNNG